MTETTDGLFSEEALEERYDLVSGRILELAQGTDGSGRYQAYFQDMAKLLLAVRRIYGAKTSGILSARTLRECQADQTELFYYYLPEHYAESYANPAWALAQFGEQAGKLLSALCSEMEAAIAAAFEGRLCELTIFMELFVQIYNCFAEDDLAEAERTWYWYFHDYSEIFVENQVKELVCPEDNFFTDIIMHADLSDIRYLYQYGIPVGENEIGIAQFLNEMPEEEVRAMADTFTEGYRIGFEVTGKDITKKKTVSLTYALGFERMMRYAIENFEKIGLKPTIGREAASSFFNKGNGKRGAYSTSLNRQYDFDHKEDKALYFDKAFVERRLEVLRTMFEKYKKQAMQHGGPAVLEVFGENPFSPESKSEPIRFSEKQQQLSVYNASVSGQITNEYIRGEERSFTIIAYPVPQIGADFKAIFEETRIINTLDYEKYQKMQQKIIDILDTAQFVHITGKGANHTDLTVAIHPLTDPEKQTAFENCVADVNIPVGEVFTSPVLSGTNGVLHVSEVFLNDLRYLDLEITFKDGMTESFRCGNFAEEEENKRYIRDNVLMRHDSLPMGEFAIGTNTAAYRMAKKYQIADKLPILIAEKTGPHFAVGDTCYSHAEDTAVYNPNGKEIIARDNEISLLRKEDVSKAYFNCHTDITIPYNELDAVTVIRADGSSEDIIRDGKFCVPGTEELNIPLEEI